MSCVIYILSKLSIKISFDLVLTDSASIFLYSANLIFEVERTPCRFSRATDFRYFSLSGAYKTSFSIFFKFIAHSMAQLGNCQDFFATNLCHGFTSFLYSRLKCSSRSTNNSLSFTIQLLQLKSLTISDFFAILILVRPQKETKLR